ncbi:hypothetical protein Mapa_001024 [Marchantia paleacea]|nr:hypothetical protein Mapa_001024 [Marchantia paleacea]
MQSRDERKTSFCSERMKLCQRHLSKVYGRSKTIFLKARGEKESSSVYPASSCFISPHVEAENTHHPRNYSARSSSKFLDRTKVSPYLSAVSGLFDGPTLLRKLQFRNYQSSVAKTSPVSPRARCPKYCNDGKRESSGSVPVFFEHVPVDQSVSHPAPSWGSSREALREPSATANSPREDCSTGVEPQEQGMGMGMEAVVCDGCRSGVATERNGGVRQTEMKPGLFAARQITIPEVSSSPSSTRQEKGSNGHPSANAIVPKNYKVDDPRKWGQPDSGSEPRAVVTSVASGSKPQTSRPSRSGSTSTKMLRVEDTDLRNSFSTADVSYKPERSLEHRAGRCNRNHSTGVDDIGEATRSSFSPNPGAPSFVPDLTPIRTREPLGNHSTNENMSLSNVVASKPRLKHCNQASIRGGDARCEGILVQSTLANRVSDISLAPSRPMHISENTIPAKDALSIVLSASVPDNVSSNQQLQVPEAISRQSHLARVMKASIQKLEKSSSRLWKHGSMALCTENPVRDYTTGASPPTFRIKHRSGEKVNWSKSDSRKVVNHVCQILRQHRWGPVTVETLDGLKGRLNSHCVTAVIQQISDPSLALKFFNWAKQRQGFKHDVYTYTSMITLLGRARNLQGVRTLLEDMHKDGCEPTNVTYNTLILIYGKLKSLSESLRVFRIMKEAGCKPDNVTYSILIHLCVKSGFLQEALKLYRAMLEAGIKPDTITYSIVINSLGKSGNLSEARRLFREMKEMGCVPNEFTYSSMIDSHAKSRQTEYALRYYQEMRDNGFLLNSVICTTVMSVLATLGQFTEAEALFREMEQMGIVGDTAAYSLMINTWGQAGNLDKAVSWYGRMLGNMVTPSLSVFTSLVNAHLDLHLYEGAQHFLTSMSMWGISPDLKVYTSLLRHCTGCDRQDHVDAVLGLMDRLGHPAHKFVFELLTSKDQDRRNTRTRFETFFDSVQHEDQDSRQAFANALIEFLHKLQCKTDPGFVWELALEKGLFPHAIIRRETPNHWLIDLHSMSVGTALVALPRLLTRLRDNWVQTPTRRVYIVTGWGKRSRVTGSSAMKQSVNALLQAAKSPFSADHTNAGVFVCYGIPFCSWIADSSVRRSLGLDVAA